MGTSLSSQLQDIRTCTREIAHVNCLHRRDNGMPETPDDFESWLFSRGSAHFCEREWAAVCQVVCEVHPSSRMAQGIRSMLRIPCHQDRPLADLNRHQLKDNTRRSREIRYMLGTLALRYPHIWNAYFVPEPFHCYQEVPDTDPGPAMSMHLGITSATQDHVRGTSLSDVWTWLLTSHPGVPDPLPNVLVDLVLEYVGSEYSMDHDPPRTWLVPLPQARSVALDKAPGFLGLRVRVAIGGEMLYNVTHDGLTWTDDSVQRINELLVKVQSVECPYASDCILIRPMLWVTRHPGEDVPWQHPREINQLFQLRVNLSAYYRSLRPEPVREITYRRGMTDTFVFLKTPTDTLDVEGRVPSRQAEYCRRMLCLLPEFSVGIQSMYGGGTVHTSSRLPPTWQSQMLLPTPIQAPTSPAPSPIQAPSSLATGPSTHLSPVTASTPDWKYPTFHLQRDETKRMWNM